MSMRIGCFLFAFSLLATACGSDDGGSGSGGGTCLSQCKAAQAGSCSSISDCDAFCASAPVVAGKGNCTSQWSAYESCGTSVAACEISSKCANEESAFTGCAQLWCAANASDQDCISLAGSL